jgi:deferrochelatase/peroxidase EfeB
MVGGTYLGYRRIRMRLQAWDRSAVAEQERAIGRRKASGAPLGGRDEREPLDPAAVPPRSHAHAMHPEHNGGVRLLRRSYNYDDGATADGDADAGLAFICFAADPGGQLGGLLRRFERDDDLRDYAVPTAGGVFAIPPAPVAGEHIGERLLT